VSGAPTVVVAGRQHHDCLSSNDGGKVQSGGGIQDGPVLQLARDTSKNQVAVVHLVDNRFTKVSKA